MHEPLIYTPPLYVPRKQTGICLNMIVRDESPVIERLLRSVACIVDYFFIVDTGSCDGTPELIMQVATHLDLPGEVHFRNWVNYGYNRQQALELLIASEHCEWALIIDADEELVCPQPDFFTRLQPGVSYLLDKHHGEARYALPNLVDVRRTQWQWRGPVHEYLAHRGGSKRRERCGQAWILYHEGEGVRSRGKSLREKYLNDAAILEDALIKNPNDARNRFFLAQSYRDAGENQLAFENYKRRARMSGDNQETYAALCEKARLSMLLGHDLELILRDLLRAYEMRPQRAEALWLIARYCRIRGFYNEGYHAARLGLQIPVPDETQPINRAVYDWRLFEEYALCAQYIGNLEQAKLGFKRALAAVSLPAPARERIQLAMKLIAEGEKARHMIKLGLFPS